MTQQERESVEMVAKFMGGDFQIRYETDGSMSYRPDKFWQLLMSVVEKIESLENEDGYHYTIDICGTFCEVNDDGAIVSRAEGLTKIESVYRAVLGFITWYNKNIKPA